MTDASDPRGSGAQWGSEAGEVSDPAAGTEEIFEGELVDDLVDDVSDEPVNGVNADPLVVALGQRDEYLDSLRRLQADFENYKKRVTKQQADQVARAAVSLVDKVLPVLDTLDLATEHLGDAESADARALVAVSGQLHDVLAKEGLERIDPLGEEFDPNAHEAVGHLPGPDPAEVAEADADGSGEATADETVGGHGEPVVGQVMRAGYRWRGTVIRPAMVMVQG